MAAQRKLAAIFAADLVGSSSMMAHDEEGAVARIGALRDELLAERIAAHRGRIFKTMGDGLLAEFSSAVEAVRAATEIQTALREQNNRLPIKLRMELRIGINLGDVIIEGDDMMGDGVNVATRLEQIAHPGGVSISAGVLEQIAGKIDIPFDDRGFQTLKNMDRPIHLYEMRMEGDDASTTAARGMFDFSVDRGEKPQIMGGCLCGSVRFEAHEAPLGAGYCHCRICQRFTGAPVAAWTAFAAGAIHFLKGAPRTFGSSLIAERGFCSNCGSALTYRLVKPGETGYLVIFTAALDHPERFAPTSHGGVESQMPWLQIHDDLPRTRCDESWALRNAWGSVGLEDPENWEPATR